MAPSVSFPGAFRQQVHQQMEMHHALAAQLRRRHHRTVESWRQIVKSAAPCKLAFDIGEQLDLTDQHAAV